MANKLHTFGQQIKDNINENIAKPVNNSNFKGMLKGQKKKVKKVEKRPSEEGGNRNLY